MTRAATAYIKTNALQHNLNRIKQQVPGAKVLAVIKANGYGHGMVRVASALSGADAFAVARLEEALALRHARIDKRIVLLQGFIDTNELLQLSENNIDTVVHHAPQIEMLESIALEKPVSVWLKIDTGMHRLGFDHNDADQARRRLQACTSVAKPIFTMSHFANADVAGDQFTTHQIELFNQTTANWDCERSIANSAGIFAWPQSQCDWVRPGISLYGISPFDDRDAASLNLLPVMSLHSRLVAMKILQPGESVGYGHHWRAEKATTIGIVGIGYADGYPRHARNDTPVVINGQRYPLIGRVSMDSLCVNLGPAPKIKIGDDVELWGDRVSVEEIARYANTIPYELVCKVASRVRFVEITS